MAVAMVAAWAAAGLGAAEKEAAAREEVGMEGVVTVKVEGS